MDIESGNNAKKLYDDMRKELNCVVADSTKKFHEKSDAMWKTLGVTNQKMNLLIDRTTLRRYNNGYGDVHETLKKAVAKGYKPKYDVPTRIVAKSTISRRLLNEVQKAKSALKEYGAGTINEISLNLLNGVDEKQAFQNVAGNLSLAAFSDTPDSLPNAANSRVSYLEDQAYLTGSGEMRKAWHENLVIVKCEPGACKTCAEYDGKILIDDVYSDGKKDDYEKDYGLLSEAMEKGFRHPNCKCGVMSYIEATYVSAHQEDMKINGLIYRNSDSGVDILELQILLNKLGYTDFIGKPLLENGIFDQDTLYALIEFKDKFLPDGNKGDYYGLVGPTTMEVLRELTNESLASKETGDTFQTENFYYLRNTELVSQINGINADFDEQIENFKDLYFKYKDRYELISIKTGVPPELIAAIHYHENASDFDWINGTINFSVYLHNGQKLGKTTTIEPKGVLFTGNQFDEAAVDALEGKPWSQVKDSVNEQFKANNLSAYNATGLKDGNDSLVAMLTFAEYYNGANKNLISTYVFNGALDANGANIPGTGKFTSDGNYDFNAINKQPGIYLLLKSILE